MIPTGLNHHRSATILLLTLLLFATSPFQSNAADSCDREKIPERNYIAKNDALCSFIKYKCGENEVSFNDGDNCGCGCTDCRWVDPKIREYVMTQDNSDFEFCSDVVSCDDETETFFINDCGCGCDRKPGFERGEEVTADAVEKEPTYFPTSSPTRKPTLMPTDEPTLMPTGKPTSHSPTYFPTSSPISKLTTMSPTEKVCSRDLLGRRYEEMNNSACDEAWFPCAEFEVYFNDFDDCGCGCSNCTALASDKKKYKFTNYDLDWYDCEVPAACNATKGEEFFRDDCGCGCLKSNVEEDDTNSTMLRTSNENSSKTIPSPNPPSPTPINPIPPMVLSPTLNLKPSKCLRDNPARRYVAKSDKECAIIRFFCENDEVYFSDKDGCGCGCTDCSANKPKGKRYEMFNNHTDFYSCEESISCNASVGESFFRDECGCGCGFK